MAKALLYTILLATLILPIMAARKESRQAGLQRVIVWMCAFCFVYVVFALYVYPVLKR
jgi:uncharacterized membrane protein